MINYDLIRDKASAFRSALQNEYGTSGVASLHALRNIIGSRYGLDYSELAMGAQEDSVKGLILKSSRMVSIVANSDLPEAGRILVLVHELGHYHLGHLRAAGISRLFDNRFGFRRDNSLTARMENEANFFAADVLLNTEETLDAIRTNDLMTSASLLRVPVEILDFKLRLLSRSGNLAEYQDVLGVRSDCLKNMRIEKSAYDYY